MPEPQNLVVGTIEVDVGQDCMTPMRVNERPHARLAGAEHPRLKTTMPPTVTLERIAADMPRLATELRAELRQFLDRLQAAA